MSLKLLRTRVKSLKSTQKIIKAMKMIAAFKLKRAEHDKDESKIYASELNSILAKVSSVVRNDEALPDIIKGKGDLPKKIKAIVITSDKGLCGGFNLNLVKFALNDLSAFTKDGYEISFIVVGRKGSDVLSRKHKDSIESCYMGLSAQGLEYEIASDIANNLYNDYKQEQYEQCFIYYNHFKNVITTIPKRKDLVPIESILNSIPQTEEDFLCEPKPLELLDDLIVQALALQIFIYMLENIAGEYASRMTAMDSANKNASKMINNLTLKINRTRQAIITKELIEIIAGADAV